MLTLVDLNYLPAFLLIFIRLLAFVATVPIFSYRNIPNPFKIGFALFMSWIIVITMDLPVLEIDLMFIVLILKEVLVGLIIGLVATLILTAVQIAGGFIDFQMGFAIANVMDPQTGAQGPIIGQYFYTFALMFLLAIDGHHLLINGAFYSFELIKLDQFIDFSNPNYIIAVVTMFNQIFLIAFQMAIPIVGSLFLVDVALGIIARTVPQLNVFVVGIPLKITVSFFSISIFIVFYISLVRRLFGYTLDVMDTFMRILGGV
ncbi:flagellar type III secretion system protein FliR [Amphibacillus sp. MSJ-3]|uniref:flagellar biosynthetic protein FliR n=1 Tax=Amphibacillus sp. MSJ-3 TaxID=2841505 RepID=UPI001C0E9D47|nr:flagellar biosynthetic protein FliR [Amphibacillus sp. MSJ-3]MBU5594973.1 flagellar type III secretion system protein FliR [Amphibacillus sp. MSJ-3]